MASTEDATLRALCEAELAGLPTWREAVHALLDRVAEAERRAEEAEGKLARLQEDAIDIHERANRAEAKLGVAVAALKRITVAPTNHFQRVDGKEIATTHLLAREALAAVGGREPRT